MKSAGSIALIFLTLISNSLMLDLSKFWTVNQSPIVMEPARPIEIVRWRQPVCLMPSQGVLPCYLGLRKLQDEYDRVSREGVFQETRSSVSSQDEVLTFSGTDVPSASNLAPMQSSGGSEEAAIGRSQSRTPELTLTQDNIEERRYLGIRGETTPKPQQIYVTRVVNAPMTATLVAHNCLPDIGIPLCQDYQPIQPSKPVFHSQPAETETPTIGNKPGNCQNPNHVFHDNQNFSTTLHDPVVKPIPTRRPVQRLESYLVPAVCHSCVQNGVTSGKLGHVVISKPGGEVVEARPLATGGSTFHYFDSASHADQQIKSVFDIQLSKNSGSEIEGQAVERPRTAPQSLDQLTTTFNIQSSRNSGSHEIEGQGPEVESSERKKSKNTIVQTIHEVVNMAEKLPIVQTVQNFLQRPGPQEGSSEGPAFLGNIFRPINLFNRQKDSTMSRPESSTQIAQTGSVSSTSDVEESTTNVSVIEIVEKPAIMDILHKPENNISNSTGLLDIFESAQPVDNVDTESLPKPTEKPGLLGDLFANPVGPIEAENGKVEAKGN